MDKDERTPVDGAAAQGARVGAQVGSAVGAAVGTALEQAARRTAEARTAATRGYGSAREKVATADTGALVKQIGEVLEGVVEDGRERAMTTFGRTPPPKRSRLPWAAAAVVAGGAAGAAVAFAVRRLVGQDAPDAQEPDQLRAVVDTGAAVPSSPVATVPVVVPPSAVRPADV